MFIRNSCAIYSEVRFKICCQNREIRMMLSFMNNLFKIFEEDVKVLNNPVTYPEHIFYDRLQVYLRYLSMDEESTPHSLRAKSTVKFATS